MPFYCTAPTTEYVNLSEGKCTKGYDFIDNNCCDKELFDLWEWTVWGACAGILCCVITFISMWIAKDRRSTVIAKNKQIEE